jgi:hypothetical protein
MPQAKASGMFANRANWDRGPKGSGGGFGNHPLHRHCRDNGQRKDEIERLEKIPTSVCLDSVLLWERLELAFNSALMPDRTAVIARLR